MRLKKALSVALSLTVAASFGIGGAVVPAVAQEVSSTQVFDYMNSASVMERASRLESNLFMRFIAEGQPVSLEIAPAYYALGHTEMGESIDAAALLNALSSVKTTQANIVKIGQYLTALDNARAQYKNVASRVEALEKLVEDAENLTIQQAIWSFSALEAYSTNEAAIQKALDVIVANQSSEGA